MSGVLIQRDSSLIEDNKDRHLQPLKGGRRPYRSEWHALQDLNGLKCIYSALVYVSSGGTSQISGLAPLFLLFFSTKGVFVVSSSDFLVSAFDFHCFVSLCGNECTEGNAFKITSSSTNREY